MEHKSTFNRVAGLYGAARPGYPDELVGDVCGFAGLRAGDPVLEVGCGAGQATASFAGRGFELTALDPGPALIEVARKRLAGLPNLAFVVAPFESWSAGDTRYKLIFAAQSWHWIPRERSFAKAADSLSERGILAVFGHVPGSFPEPLGSALTKIYREHMGDRWSWPEAGYLPTGPLARWFEESGHFGDVVHKSYRWTWHHTTSSYADFARTRSDHNVMAPQKLEALLSDIREAIETHGGAFDWPYETHLYMAKRA